MAQRKPRVQSATPRNWRSKSLRSELAARMAGSCQAMGEVPAEVAVTRAALVPAPRIDHGIR
jgi:hypothetical protein